MTYISACRLFKGRISGVIYGQKASLPSRTRPMHPSSNKLMHQKVEYHTD